MPLTDWVKIASESITAIAASSAAGVAIYGVREWKRQMKGRTDYEIARRYLKTALYLRDALRFVRNPFIPVGEMERALKEQGIKTFSLDHEKTNQAVYSVRWKKVQEAWSNLEAELLEAEVSWGKGAVIASSGLIAATRELYSAINLFISGHSRAPNDYLIYETGTLDKPDEFSAKVDKSID